MKEGVVLCFNTEAEYWAMAITIANLFWIQMLLKYLQIPLDKYTTNFVVYVTTMVRWHWLPIQYSMLALTTLRLIMTF
jgi:hypothetical protein